MSLIEKPVLSIGRVPLSLQAYLAKIKLKEQVSPDISDQKVRYVEPAPTEPHEQKPRIRHDEPKAESVLEVRRRVAGSSNSVAIETPINPARSPKPFV